MKKYFAITVFFIFSCSTAIAQQITAQKIMQNLKEHFDAINDYTVTLNIKPHIERFNTKEMRLRLYYKQPDKVHIESKGFVMIPRQLFETNPSQLLSKFDPILIETKKDSGRTIYVLRLLSKPEKNHPALENYVFIDGERWVILKLQSIPAEGRTIDISFDYINVDNKYILPSLMNASFNFGNEDETVAKMKGFKGMPTKGTIEIRYSDYQVNKGLNDEIFEKKKER
jgi:outer membrane lipoprotein-sorting protein